jgi:hypothetical protein
MAAAKKKHPTATKLIRAADVKPEKLDFLWLDRIPKGTITLIGGRPGQGKSLFTTYLAAEVTRRGGAVIMSNPEDQLAPVKVPRLIAAEADSRLVHFWPGKLRLPDDVAELEELVLFHGVQLVTIDPIAKHVGGRDPNTALEPLAAMAERTGVAVVGVHHLNKRLPKDAHPQEAFGGASGGWLGTVRFAHVLGPAGAGEPESRFLGIAKANNADENAPSLEFYMDVVEVDLPGSGGEVAETGRLVFVNDNAPVTAHDVVQWRGAGFNAEANPEKKAVASEFLTLLLMKGAVPAKEIFNKAAEYGVSKMTVRRAADEIGVVKNRVGFGPGSYLVWSLPDDHPLVASLGPAAPKKTPPKGKAKPNGGGEVLDGQMDVDEAIRQILAEADGKDGEGDDA